MTDPTVTPAELRALRLCVDSFHLWANPPKDEREARPLARAAIAKLEAASPVEGGKPTTKPGESE
jgi:hypothetical protein